MRVVTKNNIEIEVEEDGDCSHPAVILVPGASEQVVDWPIELVRGLVKNGFRVIRLDNRDSGFSHDFRIKSVLAFLWAYFLFYFLNIPPYTLSEMAEDLDGVLRAKNINSAHFIGRSMGGMISQRFALHYPQKILSLTCIMSSPGNPRLDPKLKMLVRQGPRVKTAEGRMNYYLEVARKLGSPGYPESDADVKKRIEFSCRYRNASRKKGKSFGGQVNQYFAMASDNGRRKLLGSITAPTLVIHGEADPFVSVRESLELARLIPGAKLITYPGMGHELPKSLVPRITSDIIDFIAALNLQ